MCSRSKFNWIDGDVVAAIHEAQIAEHGGAAGVRDPGLLASAIVRPQNAATYSDVGVPDLAALYALAIIRNHPFLDGNKRVGAVLLELFLSDNGDELAASDETFLAVIRAVAAGEMSDEDFSTWVHGVARHGGAEPAARSSEQT